MAPPFEGNTGSNMTLLLQESFVTSLNIQTSNAYIVATTETSLVVGSSYLNNSQTSLAVWGDDSFTSEIDGATDGQLINLHLIDSNLLYDINISLNYVTNNLDVITNEVSPVLTCTAENLGCTDESACNYNTEAIIEDGSCSYSETYLDCNGNCINDSDADGICDEMEVPGCTNPIASNYNNIATDDDGTLVSFWVVPIKKLAIGILKQIQMTDLVFIQKPISTVTATVLMIVMEMAFVMNWKYQDVLILMETTTTVMQHMMMGHVSF